MKRNPHVAIMQAAKRGKGLRLSADEVWELSQDDAIAQRATVVVEELLGEARAEFWCSDGAQRGA